MDLTENQTCLELQAKTTSKEASPSYINLEAEIPEVLYKCMKDFIFSNPNWDQYEVMSTALANFLFQNGSEDRAVTERYLNVLFKRSSD